MTERSKKYLATFLAVLAASVVLVAPAQAQTLSVATSTYWCAKLGGQYAGGTCMARYVPHPGACDRFRALNVDDQQMLAKLRAVQSASVCLASVVKDAKTKTLKLRADLMGYVSLGRDETVNDPIQNRSFQAEPGEPTYWPAVAYFLYQCVVETCTSK